jgi:hypothetical protein
MAGSAARALAFSTGTILSRQACVAGIRPTCTGRTRTPVRSRTFRCCCRGSPRSGLGPSPTPTARTEQVGDYSAVGLVSVAFEGSRLLVRRLRAAGVLSGWALPWGAEALHLALHQMCPQLLLLDGAATAGEVDLLRHVRALAFVGPTAALTTTRADAVELFAAGAADVLNADADGAEVAARLRARTRRLPRPVDLPDRIVCERSTTQRGLLVLLSRIRGRVCCQDLGVLLGPPGMPLNPRAVHARMRRAGPVLRRHGIVIHTTSHWNAVRYERQS